MKALGNKNFLAPMAVTSIPNRERARQVQETQYKSFTGGKHPKNPEGIAMIMPKTTTTLSTKETEQRQTQSQLHKK